MWRHRSGLTLSSGNGTKPLPEPMFIYHISVRSSDIHLRAISQEKPQHSITEISPEITDLRFHSNLPGANELTPMDWQMKVLFHQVDHGGNGLAQDCIVYIALALLLPQSCTKQST